MALRDVRLCRGSRECRIWQGYLYGVALTPKATKVYLVISLAVLIPQPYIPFPIDLLLLPLFLSDAWLVIGDIVQVFNYITHSKLIKKSRCFTEFFLHVYQFVRRARGYSRELKFKEDTAQGKYSHLVYWSMKVLFNVGNTRSRKKPN
jgi:hypothetical protein